MLKYLATFQIVFQHQKTYNIVQVMVFFIGALHALKKCLITAMLALLLGSLTTLST